MAISPALDIARRALIAQETALAVTGHNIANVNTPGFTRQIPDFESEPGRPVGGNAIVGGGVRLDSVRQVIDPLLARRRLAAETDLGEQAVRRDQLGQLAGVVNDLAQPSLASALDGFFDAADALARNPGGLAERQTLLGRATAVGTELNRRSDGIASLQRAADDQIVKLTGDVNTNLQTVADLNRAIVATEIEGQPANDLRDQRQNALNTLASLIGITTVEDPRGSVTVSSTAGPVLVTGNVVHKLAVQTGGPGLDASVLHDVGLEDSTGAFLPASAVFDRGTVRGLLDVRDGSLVTASTNLDAVAGALRDAVNAIQTDPAARDLNGNPTTAAPLFTGTGAHDFQLAIADPRLIGAALSTDPGDNRNALLLADLRTTPPLTVVTAHGQTSAAATAVGTASLAQYLAGELGRVGSESTQADEIASHAQNLVKTLESQRASLSGVNLNEELTDLLKYQHAFQAAAQILNATNSMLDELMKIVI